MLTHLDESGRARMVDVGGKDDTERVAIAKGSIKLSPEIFERIQKGNIKKGDVLAVAQVAGIMGAKKTAENIPMCHNIFITGVDMDFEMDKENSTIHIQSTVRTIGKTGVEMEALNAVSTAALTIYDMCKAIDKGMVITNIRLIKKTGGKSGTYIRGDEADEG